MVFRAVDRKEMIQKFRGYSVLRVGHAVRKDRPRDVFQFLRESSLGQIYIESDAGHRVFEIAVFHAHGRLGQDAHDLISMKKNIVHPLDLRAFLLRQKHCFDRSAGGHGRHRRDLQRFLRGHRVRPQKDADVKSCI